MSSTPDARPLMQRLEDALVRLERAPWPWWSWPATLVGTAVFAVVASLVVTPSADPRWTQIFGARFGGECGFETMFAQPCPSCGMTRSWVWAVRGHLVEAFTYNAAGAMLVFWILIAGVIGARRLITRNPEAWKVPFHWLSLWVAFWMIGPYLGLWVARLLGINPLP